MIPHQYAETHEVTNQVPPLDGANLYRVDVPLQEWVRRYGGGFAEQKLDAYGALAGLWLWHDGLHECHGIVQKEPDELPPLSGGASRLSVGLTHSPALDRDSKHVREMTETFAFWHAIMHRREGDFGNSKYWYAHCRSHPLLAAVAANAREVIARAPADKALLRFSMNEWNGAAFVDFVQRHAARPAAIAAAARDDALAKLHPPAA